MSTRFASQAPNAQDVVLWRVLQHLPTARVAEVGDGPSLLPALLERGWVLAAPDEPVVVLSVHGALPSLFAEPWIVVVTDPSRGEPPVAEGYVHVLFDGVSDYLVHQSRITLADPIDHAACLRDDYSTPRERELEADVARWRDRALESWEERSTEKVVGAAELALEELHASLSWRVTAPLRAVSARVPSRHRG